MQRGSAQRPLKNARISSRVLVLSLSKDLDHTVRASAYAYRTYSENGQLEEWRHIAPIVRSEADTVAHSLVQRSSCFVSRVSPPEAYFFFLLECFQLESYLSHNYIKPEAYVCRASFVALLLSTIPREASPIKSKRREHA